MYKYIAKRLALMIPTLLGAAVFVFLLLRMIPGDVCEVRLAGTGMDFDPEQIDIWRENVGLNKPLAVQFIEFIWGYFIFDFGVSMWTEKPIGEEISLRFALSL